MPEYEISLAERQKFLLLFTRELIYNSNKELFNLVKRINKEKISDKPKQKIQNPARVSRGIVHAAVEGKEKQKKDETPMTKSIMSSNLKPPVIKEHEGNGPYEMTRPKVAPPPRKEIAGTPAMPPPRPIRLNIPQPRLPPEFQYLKPIPTQRDLDLAKLNPLVGDPGVQVIECEGPDKPIIVSGRMGRQPSQISLSNEEIQDIINRFSEASRIPVDMGVFKVVFGRLIFSAVISDVVPSRFMIKKMYLPPSMMRRPAPQQAMQRMDYSNYIKR